jgi:bacillithiol biosynthesis cysteine-adding enzyme BshC
MQVQHIPLTETSLMHKLTKRYLQADESVSNLYQWPLNFEGSAQAIEARKSFPVNRELLVSSLQKQYNTTLNISLESADNKLVADNIFSLQQENTFTVTTGHQLNIFTGPLYFIYKIVSTIKYAQQLKQQFPENNFVPVYWMASEDHDFEEINHIYLWGKMLQWQTESKTAVGYLDPKSLENVIAELEQILGTRPNLEQIILLFKQAYLQQNTLAQATRFLVHELFKDYGLVIIDADDANLKKSFIPVFERDIFENNNFYIVNKTLETLEKEYKIPVKPREINVFYLDANIRTRIVQNGDNYEAKDAGKTWSTEELRKDLHENPQHFSPNVVMRPMYQETILPNLAYIGGTNEIAYWLELKNAFIENNVFFPQLVVRDSALWIGKGANKTLSASKLQAQDMLLSFTDLKAKFYDNNEITHPAENRLANLISDYESLRQEIQGLSSDLVANVIKSINLQSKELKKWKSEVKKSVEAGQEKAIEKIQKTYNSINPDGKFKERHDNFLTLYCQYGSDFIPALVENFDPLNGQLHIFIED